ncbi:MAG TPA: hypothetical protein VFV38_08430 [Ktedonobacteraceae bacterium]|nr:hypothetical protein [Ktedonobacteraceae bacterium]
MSRSALPESRQIGTTMIHVQDEDFFNGFQVGTLLYRLQVSPAGFSDQDIYTLICKHSQDIHTTDRYRAGAIAGWFAALYDYHLPSGASLPLTSPTQEAPHV